MLYTNTNYFKIIIRGIVWRREAYLFTHNNCTLYINGGETIVTIIPLTIQTILYIIALLEN